MRYMGIDYGTKRIGVAFSDEEGVMAFPHSVLPNTKNVVAALVELGRMQGVGAVVAGHSTGLDGKENPVAKRAGACARALADALQVPLFFESEIYSTQAAMREQGKHELTDASAAAIILNSYLVRIRTT